MNRWTIIAHLAQALTAADVSVYRGHPTLSTNQYDDLARLYASIAGEPWNCKWVKPTQERGTARKAKTMRGR